MKTATEAFAKINKAATTASPDVRVCRRLEIGQILHQGDVYLVRVADDHPRGAAWGSRQVAIGDTQGSRHVAEGDVSVWAGVDLPPGFKAPAWLNGANPKPIFLGPVVEARSTWTLTHPEHADHECAAGTYQVVYQADARQRARVAD